MVCVMQSNSLPHIALSTAGSTRAGSTVFPRSLVQRSWAKGFISKKAGVSFLYMRNLLWLLLCGSLLLTVNLTAATISYTVTPLGSGVYEFTYFLSGTFGINQEIDIQFDPAEYTLLANGQPAVSGDWDTMVFQPNVPPGQPGDYTLFALVNNPSTAGPFSIDATYSSGTDGPGSQFFTIQQFDESGLNIIGQVGSGWTTPNNTDPVPEPAGFWLSAVGLLVVGALKAVRRQQRRAAE